MLKSEDLKTKLLNSGLTRTELINTAWILRELSVVLISEVEQMVLELD